jgi:hypothetical protein
MIYVDCVVKPYMRKQRVDPYLDWCDEQLDPGTWYSYVNGIAFINEEDAIAFKLKFGL